MVDFDFQFSPTRRFKGVGIYGVVALALVLATMVLLAATGAEAALFTLRTLRTLLWH
jgi:hypothetical protein